MGKIVAALSAVALLVIFGNKSWAFHDGGAGACEGCHTVHNSSGGRQITGAPNQYLLRGQDPSSVCLNCHQETGGKAVTTYFISTASRDMPAGSPPIELTPGGDFGWLKKSYIWVVSGVQHLDRGERHGHNIISGDYNYVMDTTYMSAPGGTYPASALSCISCHDPHGRYRRNLDGSITTSGAQIIASGSFDSSPVPSKRYSVGVYRLLGGVGYQQNWNLRGNYAFTEPPPAAVAPLASNRSEAVSQTRVAYGTGMSAWCRNCHPNIHATGGPPAVNGFPQTHSSGTLNNPAYDWLGAQMTSNYNKYIITGNWTGQQNFSYSSLVPYEENTSDYSVLKSSANITGSSLTGPKINGTDYVSCMSCHRAHASGWDYILRFKYTGISDGSYGFSEIMTYNRGGSSVWPGTDTTPADPADAMGRTSRETQQAYYGRSASLFAPGQKVLCVKCHVGSVTGAPQRGY